MSISNLSAAQLRKAATIVEQIEKLNTKLADILGDAAPAAEVSAAIVKVGRKHRKMSAAGRAAIAAGQKARWAKAKGETAEAPKAKKPGKRKISAAGIAKIKAAQKARWAKLKAEKEKAA